MQTWKSSHFQGDTGIPCKMKSNVTHIGSQILQCSKRNTVLLCSCPSFSVRSFSCVVHLLWTSSVLSRDTVKIQCFTGSCEYWDKYPACVSMANMCTLLNSGALARIVKQTERTGNWKCRTRERQEASKNKEQTTQKTSKNGVHARLFWAPFVCLRL